MNNKKPLVFALVGVIIVIMASLFYVVLSQSKGSDKSNTVGQGEDEPVAVELQEVKQSEALEEQYDVVVVGTDPEGVMAAISAARNGLKTLLVDGKDREVLGGLFTVGWLNSLDMNGTPDRKGYYNEGLFKEWFEKVEGDSFDITTAANAFHEMVAAEENIDVQMGMKSIEPVTEQTSGSKKMKGVKLVTAEGEELVISSHAVIDATQDADIAAAAGAKFTFGREDIGDSESLMAVTPVYTLTNVTPKVWKAINDRLNGDDDPGTGANAHSAWGYAGMWKYESTNPERIRTRGPNLGRLNNETMLVNAVQIFDVDPFDPQSVEEAYEIARKELPLMLDFMKELYPELEPVELGELAQELYVRETRHLIGEYRLSTVDLLEQRRHWDEIAFGSYPVDIQSTSPSNSGTVLMDPEQYGVPFRTLVPKELDGLLVVGRSASFDSLPHGSARVVPLGMATAQAAGAAVKLAIDNEMTFRELSASKLLIAELQKRLTAQGMKLNPPKVEPFPYMSHPSYEGLKAAASMGIATSGYSNDFKLDEPSNPERLVNNLFSAAKPYPDIFKGPFGDAIKDMDNPDKQPLTLEQAAYTFALAIFGEGEREAGLNQLKSKELISVATLDSIKDRDKLTNGDVYMLLKDIIAVKAGVTY
ncbi:FAD-dependent oxidoreductase [Paenibacillus sp. J5C_2022]|uniref:FAD-dependent oxidoreductase n=1 Tax=Paenibacillus sp. J5C2022 TaxID=2977129 RepID=UPI0021D0843F|nr:FAD-dependent oxidoreductase [Paenibacillus sp. J5C2022]MCU6711994.1 FAD-dependent oxidoreductase [Paenibacillus sp. J5C2022]